MNKKALQGVLCAFPLGIMYVLYVLYVLYASLWSIFIGWNMNKYTVTATKKAGTTYEGMMTTKEPRVANGLIAIAQADGAWIYISPDEISSVEYVPVVEVTV